MEDHLARRLSDSVRAQRASSSSVSAGSFPRRSCEVSRRVTSAGWTSQISPDQHAVPGRLFLGALVPPTQSACRHGNCSRNEQQPEKPSHFLFKPNGILCFFFHLMYDSVAFRQISRLLDGFLIIFISKYRIFNPVCLTFRADFVKSVIFPAELVSPWSH